MVINVFVWSHDQKNAENAERKKMKKISKIQVHISIQAFQSNFTLYCIQLYYEEPVKISDKKMDPNRSYC